MERLELDVRRELARFDGLPPARLQRIVELWPSAVGETVAANAWPARLARDGTLHVATSSSVWAFELTQLAPRILQRLGEDAPTAVRFALGHLPEPVPPPEPAPAREPLCPEPQDERAATELVAAIDNADLRKMVGKAAALSLARHRYGRAF